MKLMEKNKTSVEWLIEQWPILESQLPDWLINQAIQMQRDQIMDAYLSGGCIICQDTTLNDFNRYYDKKYSNESME